MHLPEHCTSLKVAQDPSFHNPFSLFGHLSLNLCYSIHSQPNPNLTSIPTNTLSDFYLSVRRNTIRVIFSSKSGILNKYTFETTQIHPSNALETQRASKPPLQVPSLSLSCDLKPRTHATAVWAKCNRMFSRWVTFQSKSPDCKLRHA